MKQGGQRYATFLLYLNDDFEGGETGYWPDHNGIHCRFIRNVERRSGIKAHLIIIKTRIGNKILEIQHLHKALILYICNINI